LHTDFRVFYEAGALAKLGTCVTLGADSAFFVFGKTGSSVNSIRDGNPHREPERVRGIFVIPFFASRASYEKSSQNKEGEKFDTPKGFCYTPRTLWGILSRKKVSRLSDFPF